MIALFLLSLGCAEPAAPTCELTSTIEGFEPSCEEAELHEFEGESRLIVAGTGGTLVAYLPEQLSEQVYGGTSGNYLLVLLEIGGVELSPNDRQTTVTFGELTDDQATVRANWSETPGPGP